MRGVFSRVGDNHQIFPEDGHRVAFAGDDVNAYSVNSCYWMHRSAERLPQWAGEIDPHPQSP
jgi:hypothetical protein